VSGISEPSGRGVACPSRPSARATSAMTCFMVRPSGMVSRRWIVLPETMISAAPRGLTPAGNSNSPNLKRR